MGDAAPGPRTDLRDVEIDSGAQWLGNDSYSKDVDLSCEDSAKVLGQ